MTYNSNTELRGKLIGSIRQTLLLLVMAGLLGGLSYLIHPGVPPLDVAGKDPLSISFESFEESVNEVVLVDARSRSDYDKHHLQGAILINEDHFNDQLINLLDVWKPGQMIVVYCEGGDCLASRAVAKRLRQALGMDQAYYLKGGIDSWEE